MHNSDLIASKYVTAAGIRYHYLSAGEGSPVLLLHGFPENSASFEHNITALTAAGHTVIIPDLKGYGNTDKPMPGTPNGDYRLSRVSVEIAELITALGYSNIDIVGHDWGGAILSAMMLTARHKIARAVLLNAPFRRFLPHKTRHFYKFNLPYLTEAQFHRDPVTFLTRIFDHWCAEPGTMSNQAIESYAASFDVEQSFECALAYYRALPKDLPFILRAMTMRQLPSGPFPRTLVLFGAEDPILPPTVARWAHQDIDGSKLVLVDGAGHFVHSENPSRTNAELVSFLSHAG